MVYLVLSNLFRCESGMVVDLHIDLFRESTVRVHLEGARHTLICLLCWEVRCSRTTKVGEMSISVKWEAGPQAISIAPQDHILLYSTLS